MVNNKYQIAAIVALCVFMSSIHCRGITQSAMTEPAFLLFTLISVYFLVDDRTSVKGVTLSTIFGSLSYYVRPNGIFFIGVIILFLFIRAEFDRAMKVKLILWVIWGAQHLEGKMAIVEGGNILEIAQHYSEFTKEKMVVVPFMVFIVI